MNGQELEILRPPVLKIQVQAPAEHHHSPIDPLPEKYSIRKSDVRGRSFKMQQ